MDRLKMVEVQRLALQTALDAGKSKAERNQLGQFATPSALAIAILEQASRLLPPHEAIRFLDPAVGTGAFYSALFSIFPKAQIALARGYEIDSHYGEPAQVLWRDYPLELVLADFTTATPPPTDQERYNLIICNPPYVRHHHLTATTKQRLQREAGQIVQQKISGLSGLYVYFMAMAHAWLAEGGIAGWLIPSEFMEVNYGQALRQYFTSEVTLLQVHRFDPQTVQFDDALVSSVVVWYRKQAPPSQHQVRFSFGGTLHSPALEQTIALTALRQEHKWTRFPKHAVRSSQATAPRLRDLFDIKRGVATGANDFFILNAAQVRQHGLPAAMLTPILPSPRHLDSDEILATASGMPHLQSPRFLITCDLSEAEIAVQYPALWDYLQSGVQQGVHEGYLCRHRPRWYAQDKRAPAPFLCTYMGRASNDHKPNPFRFIVNHSSAIAPNVYLNLYPKPSLVQALTLRPDLKAALWHSLRGVAVEKLVGEGRVYGGGLYKLEPKELGNLLLTDLCEAPAELLSLGALTGTFV